MMALALLCTLAAVVLFQPALMGPPRGRPKEGSVPDENDPSDACCSREHRPEPALDLAQRSARTAEQADCLSGPELIA